MSRTTLNIDTPVLDELRKLQKRTGKPLGRLASDLLNQALRLERTNREIEQPFVWFSKPMGSRIDLEDKDAVWAVLDQEGQSLK